MTADVHDSLAGARPEVFWSDRGDAPARRPMLQGAIETDLVVVGGGFSGLWAAMHASETPGRKIVVLEAERIGHGASSRNGGFCDASLTHGLHNGLAHWPDEIDTLVRLGGENLDDLMQTVADEGITAGIERTATLSVATEPWQLAELQDCIEVYASHGESTELLDAAATRARLDSPTYLGATRSDGGALVDPARLTLGLTDALERRGVALHDDSAVVGIDEDGSRLCLRTSNGTVRADGVIVATNAYRGPIKQPRRYVIPVWDFVLMTEPLSDSQLGEIGWSGREGLSDAGNQFHYYRLTEDNRILWGGYDAIYHFGNKVDDALGQRRASHEMLAEHFFTTFPQLDGLRFTHRWGGPIGTTSRFTATWGTSHHGRLSWVAGYTGLGVGASRFGWHGSRSTSSTGSTPSVRRSRWFDAVRTRSRQSPYGGPLSR